MREPDDALLASLLASYERVPYESLAQPWLHPDCLATAARLRGLDAPAVERARVLELGCATGQNLIALAVALPGASFVGVDLSAGQIAAARRLASEVGLSNLSFVAADLRDLAELPGEFDYVLCHGVYSHVPPSVQHAILALCAQRLAPTGVAYVSYNAYPGWHLRGMVRDLLRRHVVDREPTPAAAREAMACLERLARHAGPAERPYAIALRHEAARLGDGGESYVVHEFLAPVNTPFYLQAFVERAHDAGLEYLGDAEPEPAPVDLPAAFAPMLAAHAEDSIARAQCLDLLQGRAFRRTLLYRAGAERVTRSALETLAPLWLRARAAPVPPAPDAPEGSRASFRTRDGHALETSDPLFVRLMQALYQAAPRPLRYDTLREKLATDPAVMSEMPRLADSLLRLHRSQLLQLQTHAIGFEPDPGERPCASPLARAQAARGPLVTTLRHDNLALDDSQRALLRLLDGRRDRAALLRGSPGLSRELLDITIAQMASQALLL